MLVWAFTSGLARDAVPASNANLTCRLQPPRGDIVAAAAALTLPLAEDVRIFQGWVSAELSRSAVRQ
jgi:hypothetical protein